MRGKIFFILAILLSLSTTNLFGDDQGTGNRHELGFWVGASNPMTTSPLGEILDSSVGGGLFYRVDWPWVLHTEVGALFGTYDSTTTQKLSIVPVYAALVYRLPIPYKLNVHLKLGGGSSYVEVRPQNKSAWDPVYFAGSEFSLMASKKLRIGLRLDYYYIQESHLARPIEKDYYLYYSMLKRDPAQSFDPRIYQSINYKLVDGQFVNLALMISFFL